jgi:hypothetical protein
MSGNNHNQNAERMYTRKELEEITQNVAMTTAELTKTTIMTELTEKKLLKEDTPPGDVTAFFKGLLSKTTEPLKSFAKDAISKGRDEIITSQLKSLDEKAKAREIEEIEKKYASRA